MKGVATQYDAKARNFHYICLALFWGGRGKGHISESINACSLEKLKEVREGVSQSAANGGPKKEYQALLGLTKEDMKNGKVSAEPRPYPSWNSQLRRTSAKAGQPHLSLLHLLQVGPAGSALLLGISRESKEKL